MPLGRLWEKVEFVDGHWLWVGAVDKTTGYGVFRFNGRAEKAHRAAYLILAGPIPEGLQIDHLCRVRNCVNPAHLEPVTPLENVRRGKGHGSETHCPSGHPYDDENTYRYEGRRYCRTCKKRHLRDFHERQRQVA